MPDKELLRFLEAQNQMYLKALSEIQKGSKESHWMWFIFPQLKGLGKSTVANYYGISGLKEATEYLQHPVLGKHLVDISYALLDIQGKSAYNIFGTPDDIKLRSSMTLFSKAERADDVFQKVLEKYFDGEPDIKTLKLLHL